MKPHLISTVTLVLAIAVLSPSRAQGPIDIKPTAPQPGGSRAVADLMHYEATGLSLLRPYERGKIPVLLVHGLWSNPWSWEPMIAKLQAAGLGDRFQFWTFGYSTGDPIPYSAFLLRQNLDEVRRKVDPDGADPTFAKMVVVGHSMGGLLAKMMSVESGTSLWRVFTDRPVDEAKGDPKDLELFRRAMIFPARSEVCRVVFIATPHRGSHLDRGPFHNVGTRLVRVPTPLIAVHRRLVDHNAPDFFKEHFRKALPSSIDQLEWESPLITGLRKLNVAPTIKAHSIIAVKPGPAIGAANSVRTDGLVTYDSAHLEGVLSEKVVSAGHLCQASPDVISEVKRILIEHAGP